MPNPHPTVCPKCGSTQLRWLTLRKNRVPVDVLQCQACNTAVAEDDWMVPLSPMVPGRCWNCGERRDLETCQNCGLTRAEDIQVHDELRFMLGSELPGPEATHLDAARTASRSGRRLLALKLATAAAATNENNQGEVARALRIWLLAAVGEPQCALEDARVWVEHTQDASALAWASYGQQLQNGSYPGGAADAYEKSLRKNAKQHNIRARRAQLLLELGRGGQALDEVIRVLQTEGLDDPTTAIASAVAEKLCDEFEGQYRDDEIERVVTLAALYLERSPALLAHRARVLAQQGDLAGAKRDLKAARKLNPSLEIYERVEQAMKPARTSWWRW
ncbi:MAG: zinc ribbon domain-containing protein [Myxococcota bacterium]